MAPLRTHLPERNLDVLRAFAVTSVLADHLYMGFSGGSLMWLAHWLGRAGVLAFFVHTSLVLMSSIERQGTGDAGWVGRFYVRRAFRIYPLAIAAIAFVYLAHISGEVPVARTAQPFVAPRITTLLANVFLVQNLSGVSNVIRVLWSLPIEVQMYAVLPLCYLIARSRSQWLVFAYIVGIAGAFLWRADVIPGFWRVDTMFFVPCFLCGVLAYAILYRAPVRRRLPAMIWLVFLPVVLLAAGATLPHDINLLHWESRPWTQWGYCLAIGLMIPAVAELRPGLVTTSAHTVAKYSYGVYLLHTPALWISFTFFAHASVLVQALVAAVLIVGLPIIGYHAIEAPCIRLGSAVARYMTVAQKQHQAALASDIVGR